MTEILRAGESDTRQELRNEQHTRRKSTLFAHDLKSMSFPCNTSHKHTQSPPRPIHLRIPQHTLMLLYSSNSLAICAEVGNLPEGSEARNCFHNFPWFSETIESERLSRGMHGLLQSASSMVDGSRTERRLSKKDRSVPAHSG